ncbi:MAG: protein-glutamate O-methyltransferase CheR [Gammaproteobacteria bacterium]|nr:MAG: protein-glutamate O-methyltransferase CheR [Gammaproteobacteria bacterium]
MNVALRMPERVERPDEAQLARWRGLLRERTGLCLPPERSAFLAAGLRERVRACGCPSLAHYYAWMRDLRTHAEEWQRLVDRLTVHETRFFRHPPSLALVEQVFLPEMRAAGVDCLQLWSLGCATGEEAYTLAMLMEAARSDHGYPDRYAVTATDISLAVLHRARAGEYPARRLEAVPADLRRRFLVAAGAGRVRVADVLRARTAFLQLNLVALDRFPLRDFHLIYCQNVLIYFDRELRLQLLDRLTERLVPGGVLILGPGDVPVWSHPAMERIAYEGTLAFRRRTQPEEEGNA